MRSRVFAAQDGAAHVAYTLAALAGGVLVGLAGVRGAFAAAALCVAGAALLALRLSTEISTGERPVENR